MSSALQSYGRFRRKRRPVWKEEKKTSLTNWNRSPLILQTSPNFKLKKKCGILQNTSVKGQPNFISWSFIIIIHIFSLHICYICHMTFHIHYTIWNILPKCQCQLQGLAFISMVIFVCCLFWHRLPRNSYEILAFASFIIGKGLKIALTSKKFMARIFIIESKLSRKTEEKCIWKKDK